MSHPIPLSTLMKRFNKRCVYCKCVVELPPLRLGAVVPGNAATRDHFLPIIHGGNNSMVNTVLACRECNGLKGNLNPYEITTFLERFGPENIKLIIQEICKQNKDSLQSL